MIAEDDMDEYEENVGGIVVAAFRFEKENPDELDVEAGTKLRTIEKREEWWLAETVDGEQCGIIPVSYVCSEEEYARMNGDVGYDVDGLDLNELGDIPIAGGQQAAEEATPEPAPPASEAAAPPPPPPEAAEQQLKYLEISDKPAPVQAPPTPPNDIAYDDLAAKFEALQKKVANTKLTISSEEQQTIVEENAHDSSPPPPNPAQAQAALAQQQQQPLPPNPAQARAAMAQQQAPPDPAKALAQVMQNQQPPPPSPAQATTQLQQNAGPPPPSPQAAQDAMARKYAEELALQKRREAETLRQLEIERERRIKAEEESKARAAQLRAKRDEELRLQREVREQDLRERQQIHKIAQQGRGGQEQQGRQAMGQAIEHVKRAVGADNEGRLVEAYQLYAETLELFSRVLVANAVRPQHAVIIERMQGYLSRMSVLEPQICGGVWSDGKPHPGIPPVTRYKKRVEIMTIMARAGFDPVPYGDELRLKARFAESTGDIRTAFRNYNEGLEYYMTVHHRQKEQGKPTDKAVLGHITSALDTAEKLKAKLL